MSVGDSTAHWSLFTTTPFGWLADGGVGDLLAPCLRLRHEVAGVPLGSEATVEPVGLGSLLGSAHLDGAALVAGIGGGVEALRALVVLGARLRDERVDGLETFRGGTDSSQLRTASW